MTAAVEVDEHGRVLRRDMRRSVIGGGPSVEKAEKAAKRAERDGREAAEIGRAVQHLALVFDELAPRLLLVAHHLTGRTGENAEDLVQETFLQAYRKWDQFEGRSEPSTWLYTIAARICQRMHRRRAGEPERLASLDELLQKLTSIQGSDLHLKVGSPPAFRIDGQLHLSNLEKLSPEDTERFLEQNLVCAAPEDLQPGLGREQAVNTRRQ